MKHSLRISDPEPAPAGTPRDSVRSWLAVMVGMIAAPDSERRAVREELESHLRDRVRDLMVGGAGEPEATRQAISELGDAAALARRYQEAIKPSKRRLLMQVGVLSCAGAAVVLSVVALTTERQPEVPAPRDQPSAVTEPTDLERVLRAYQTDKMARALRQDALETQVNALAAEAKARAAAEALSGETFAAPTDDPMAVLSGIRVEVQPSTSWLQLFEQITPKGGALSVRIEALEASGINPGGPVGIGSFSGTAADAINAVNAILRGNIGDEIGVRVDGAAIVVAPAGYFDALEQTLATYDLSPLVRRRSERTGEPANPREVVQEVKELITSFVFPDHWKDNGGERASMKDFEGRLFVQAPKRFHPKIAWILRELGVGADQPAIGVSTRNQVPMLGDLPLLGNLFRAEQDATARVGTGPLRVRAAGDGRVSIQGPGGDIEATEVTLTPRTVTMQPVAQEKLVMKAEGEIMVITAAQSRVVLTQGGAVRRADVIEVELPDGWFVRDEWGRSVVPDKTPEPGGRTVTFSSPHGGLFGVWRRTGITSDRLEICPPGTPAPTSRGPS